MPDRDAWRQVRGYAYGLVTMMCPAALHAESAGFAEGVQPILMKYCVVCHVQGGAQGGLALYPDAWASTVGVRSAQSPLLLVDPGKPDASYLYLKLTGKHLAAEGAGELMPSPQAPLATAEIELIRRWIEQGARKDQEFDSPP